MKHGQCARCVELAAEVARLTPYVEAFRREETRADKLGTEVDEFRDQLSARAQVAPMPTDGMREALTRRILEAWRIRFPNNAYAWPGAPEDFASAAAKVCAAAFTSTERK